MPAVWLDRSGGLFDTLGPPPAVAVRALTETRRCAPGAVGAPRPSSPPVPIAVDRLAGGALRRCSAHNHRERCAGRAGGPAAG